MQGSGRPWERVPKAANVVVFVFYPVFIGYKHELVVNVAQVRVLHLESVVDPVDDAAGTDAAAAAAESMDASGSRRLYKDSVESLVSMVWGSGSGYVLTLTTNGCTLRAPKPSICYKWRTTTVTSSTHDPQVRNLTCSGPRRSMGPALN